MRSELHDAVLREGQAIRGEVDRLLAPHRVAIEALATQLLAAPDHVLSGNELQAALVFALGHDARTSQ